MSIKEFLSEEGKSCNAMKRLNRVKMKRRKRKESGGLRRARKVRKTKKAEKIEIGSCIKATNHKSYLI